MISSKITLSYGRKKKVFLTKHQRKGNKNPVIFNLTSMWVEKISDHKKSTNQRISLRLLRYMNGYL